MEGHIGSFEFVAILSEDKQFYESLESVGIWHRTVEEVVFLKTYYGNYFKSLLQHRV